MMSETETSVPRLPPAYRLVTLDSVSSTMDEARRLAEAEAEDGTLVWAREQTEGRGRLGRNWESPRGNLYLSLILRPEIPATSCAQLGFLAALAIGDAIGSVSPPMDVTYKWPNDVLLHRRKVAGILLETRCDAGKQPDYVLLGCGINVASFPRETAYPATCMRFEGTPAEVTEVEVLEAFSRHFLSWVSGWLDSGFTSARAAWLRHAERLGEEIEVRLPTSTLKGRFKDIDADGHLLLALPDGSERRIASGEVFPPV
jgi:BirA family biotin operon repressor/biotin-[acetyl-CoA-carboxylase] ligase